jgi:hypothetical protein
MFKKPSEYLFFILMLILSYYFDDKSGKCQEIHEIHEAFAWPGISRTGFFACFNFKSRVRRLSVFSVFVAFACIPVNLPANTSYQAHLPCPKRQTGKKASEPVHPVLRIVRLNIADAYQGVCELGIHCIKLMAVGKFWRKFPGGPEACLKKFITDYGYTMGKVN